MGIVNLRHSDSDEALCLRFNDIRALAITITDPKQTTVV